MAWSSNDSALSVKSLIKALSVKFLRMSLEIRNQKFTRKAFHL